MSKSSPLLVPFLLAGLLEFSGGSTARGQAPTKDGAAITGATSASYTT